MIYISFTIAGDTDTREFETEDGAFTDVVNFTAAALRSETPEDFAITYHGDDEATP